MIAVFIMIGILVAVAVPAFLNSIIQTSVVSTLRQDYGLRDCAYIKVDSSIGSLLSKTIKQVYIDCPKGEFNGLRTTSLVVFLRQVEFDPQAAVLNKDSKLKRIGSAKARIVFSQAELNRYIRKHHPDLKGWSLSLFPGKITSRAQIEMIGNVDVDFKPRVKGDRLVLEPQEARFSRSNRQVAVRASNWVNEVPIDIPVSNLPFGMKLNKILVEKG